MTEEGEPMIKTMTFRQDIAAQIPPVLPGCRIPEFRNGLIVRMPNHLGDAVMALPALSALKKILPEYCGLFVITPENLAPLYRALTIVDAIVTLKQPHRFFSADELKNIHRLRPGAALLLNHSFRDVLSLKLAGVKYLYGTAIRCRGMFLDGKFPALPHSESHQALRYLSIALALGGAIPQPFMPELVLPVPPDELPGRIKDLFPHPLLLTIAPGAGCGTAKRWPEKYFAAVAKYWIRRGGIVALTGSNQDFDICQNIQQELPENKCFNLCDKTELHELMQILRFSAFTLANDSGTMHLAAALDSPGLAVFGPTDCKDTGPLSPDWTIVRRDEKCAPCCQRKCPANNAVCMKKITPLQLIRIVRKSAKELNLPLEKYFHR